MKNSFNIEVCFNDFPINYYEWNKKSNILNIDVIRVSKEFMKSVLIYEGCVETRSRLLLISDTMCSLVLKLDRDGKILKRSFLKYKDDIEVCEFAHSLKITKLKFKTDNRKVKYSTKLLFEDELKNYILSSIKNSNDESFSKYLYFLYYDEVDNYSIKKLISAVNTSNIDKNMKLYKFLIGS